MNESPREFLELLTRSDTRMAILNTLATGASFTETELETETGIPRSTIIRILEEFRVWGLTTIVTSRYEVTLFGDFIAERLHTALASIEAMQRIQSLLTQLSEADPDVTFTDHPSSEILVPISADPGAPVRRLADLLHGAGNVRLLVPGPLPDLLNEGPTIRSGKQALDIVIPRIVFEADMDDLSSHKLRGVVTSGDVTLFSYDGDIGYFAGTIDETAVVGPTDDAGTIQGYLETRDEMVRSWTKARVGEYIRKAARVDIEDLLS